MYFAALGHLSLVGLIERNVRIVKELLQYIL